MTETRIFSFSHVSTLSKTESTSSATNLSKTLWEKEKMLVTSIFSLSHYDFYSIKDRSYHLCYLYFVVWKCFQFGQGQIFVIWEWVKHFYYKCFYIDCFKFYQLVKGLIRNLNNNKAK